MDPVYDVTIIGGGINGCGCAADAALRGLSVALCEQGDIASQTSSKSSKLIHGGLRYLEHFEFSLVRKALKERQTLLDIAPHLVHPLPFFIPYQRDRRPLWLLRAGLFLYDHLSAKNKLPRTKILHRQSGRSEFEVLHSSINQGMFFYDGITNDARLTITNALQAKDHGAHIHTYTTLMDAQVIHGIWHLSLQRQNGQILQLKSKTLINTTGPWVQEVNKRLHIPITQSLALVKGSHIVVPALYEGEHAYLLQNNDQRIIFAIPYHGHTLVGTTDVPFSGSLDKVTIEDDEVDYLCAVINHFFKCPINKEQIITTWSGVRPLIASEGKSPSTLSRDYMLHQTDHPAPAVTVYGGKITTYRQLAQDTIDTLKPYFPDLKPSVTALTKLPGAATASRTYLDYLVDAHERYHWLDPKTLKRYLNTYGTLTDTVLEGCHQQRDLGCCFMPTLYQNEVNYLIQKEWARTSEDILWRRTNLGLFNHDKTIQEDLETYLESQ
jgi:glycerol-3-phosphate dehydrogenase